MTDQPKERGILYSAAMIQAKLAGRKTQTRRLVKPSASQKFLNSDLLSRSPNVTVVDTWASFDHPGGGPLTAIKCPYGQPGDRLWARETFSRIHPGELQSLDPDPNSSEWMTVYRADDEAFDLHPYGEKWRPSIFMPRWASRITDEIVSVRVERLQEISEADAIAEGLEREWSSEKDDIGVTIEGWSYRDYRDPSGIDQFSTPVASYRTLWESINGPGSWEANPWVWVIETKMIQPKEAA